MNDVAYIHFFFQKNLLILKLVHWIGKPPFSSENFCFRVFKLQLKVINKKFCYFYSV